MVDITSCAAAIVVTRTISGSSIYSKLYFVQSMTSQKWEQYKASAGLDAGFEIEGIPFEIGMDWREFQEARSLLATKTRLEFTTSQSAYFDTSYLGPVSGAAFTSCVQDLAGRNGLVLLPESAAPESSLFGVRMKINSFIDGTEYVFSLSSQNAELLNKKDADFFDKKTKFAGERLFSFSRDPRRPSWISVVGEVQGGGGNVSDLVRISRVPKLMANRPTDKPYGVSMDAPGQEKSTTKLADFTWVFDAPDGAYFVETQPWDFPVERTGNHDADPIVSQRTVTRYQAVYSARLFPGPSCGLKVGFKASTRIDKFEDITDEIIDLEVDAHIRSIAP